VTGTDGAGGLPQDKGFLRYSGGLVTKSGIFAGCLGTGAHIIETWTGSGAGAGAGAGAGE